MAYRRWPREKSCGNSWASFSPGENSCLENLWFHRCFSQRSWLDISRLDHSWFELISSFVNCFWNLGGTSKRGCTCIHVICPYSTYSFMIHACFPFTPILFSIKIPPAFLKKKIYKWVLTSAVEFQDLSFKNFVWCSVWVVWFRWSNWGQIGSSMPRCPRFYPTRWCKCLGPWNLRCRWWHLWGLWGE